MGERYIDELPVSFTCRGEDPTFTKALGLL
jgi:hypothetical protein